jgi:hypothetical protein
MTHRNVAAALAAERQRVLRGAADTHDRVALVRCCRRSLLALGAPMNASGRPRALSGRLGAVTCCP